MKYFFSLFTLLSLFCGVQLRAQSTMVVTRHDGSQIEIRVSDIRDITFPSDDRVSVQMCYNGYWLHPGQWAQLTAVCTSAKGEEQLVDLVWKTSDPQVCTVDTDGLVTAVGEGECEVTAVAGDSRASLPIHVTSQQLLDIQIEHVGNLQCSYSVVPSDPSLRYFYDSRILHGEFSIDRLDQHGSTEQNIYHFALDWWDYCAGMYGIHWTEFMNQYGLTTGTVHEHATGLFAGSEYYVFAFAVHEDGTLASPIEVKSFTTGRPELSDITFEVTMDQISAYDATFTIIPSNDEDKYFVNVQRASYVDWFVENDRLDDMAQDLGNSFSPQVYPEAFCQGKVTRSMTDFLGTIRSNSDYYVIVFGYDDGQTSPVSLTKFHTK